MKPRSGRRAHTGPLSLCATNSTPNRQQCADHDDRRDRNWVTDISAAVCSGRRDDPHDGK